MTIASMETVELGQGSARVDWVGAYGKIRLPDITGVPAPVWFAGLTAVALLFFIWAERRQPR
jgi:hypothetical protein